jgi:hypothetical protein
MAGGVTIRVKGLDKVLKSMAQLPINTQASVRRELFNAADEMVEEASKRAPDDEGALRNAINVKHGSDSHEVYMQKGYGVYMEFGTKSKFKAPSFLGSFPARFRGKGEGSYKDALESMIGWVRRNNITGTYSVKSKRRTGNAQTREKQDRSAAYLILRKILREGLEPRPFFFNSFLIVRERLVARIKRILKEQVRK